MKRLVAVLIITLAGVWGCSQSPNNRAALVERIKILEEKNSRIEDEIVAVANARDQVRQQLHKAEDHIAKLQAVVKERDELRVQLRMRVGERDQVATQYEQFRKNVKEIVSQADSTVLRFPDGEPVSVSITVPAYQK
ncbi:MAG: hypothetical protein K1X57_20140 [Gemmataceae bacterium]|nr:hypothetical protein [Gemmataceae bacterium]